MLLSLPWLGKILREVALGGALLLSVLSLAFNRAPMTCHAFTADSPCFGRRRGHAVVLSAHSFTGGPEERLLP